MTQTEPTLTAPPRPSTVDFGAILAGHAERTARIEALRPGNPGQNGSMNRWNSPRRRRSGARKSIGWISTQEWLAAALSEEDVDA